MGGRKKLTYQFVFDSFRERGCELIETEYVNSKTPMKYIAECGHEHSISYANFKAGKGSLCERCRRISNGEKESIGENAIRRAFEKEGMTVLNSGFRKQSDTVHYIALCGHENKSDYSHFIRGVGRVCAKCSKSIQYEFDYVREYFEQNDCVLLEKTYVNCKTPMRYIALCGHESVTTFDQFKNSLDSTKRCQKCHKHTYHDVPIDRNRTASKVWRKAVYARDNYTCTMCGSHGGDLNAHHLESYDNNPEVRFSIANGVTLCQKCHIEFHMRYGFGGNTKNQFQEWIEGNTEVIHQPNTGGHRNA